VCRAGSYGHLATSADRLTRAAYAEGRVTTLELVATAQSLREAEIQLALREYDVVRAKIAAVLTNATCSW
jgi:outer membrane protein TolC